MKKLTYLFVAFVMLFSFSTAAFAQTRDNIGLYVGLVGGLSLAGDLRANYVNQFDPVDYADLKVVLRPGYLVGVKGGWQTFFTNKALVFELEYNRIGHDMDRISSYETGMGSIDFTNLPDFKASGKIDIDLLMFNVLARYPEGRIHPYAGAGIGVSHFQVSDSTNTYLNNITLITGGSKYVPAYQAVIGLDFDITRNLTLGVGYKYVFIPKVDFTNTFNFYPTTASIDYASHNLTANICFTF